MRVQGQEERQERLQRSEAASARFPVVITFKLLGWSARVHVADGTGSTICFAPLSAMRGGQLPIHADERLGAALYTIKAVDPFTQWFEDPAGRKIGAFGLTPTGEGKFIHVGAEPRFRFVTETEWLDSWDRLIPSVPIVNVLTGLAVQPRTLVLRMAGDTPAVRIVKKRLAFDIRYSLDALDEIEPCEFECLMLSAIIYTMQDYFFKEMV